MKLKCLACEAALRLAVVRHWELPGEGNWHFDILTLQWLLAQGFCACLWLQIRPISAAACAQVSDVWGRPRSLTWNLTGL